MKVSFSLDVNKDNADSGKHKFFIRMSKEMKKSGIKIVNKNADIHLSIPGTPSSSSSKINVLRLDGLILNSRWDYKKDNRKILKAINKSDALVYQGNFCREAYRRFLGITSKKEIVIPNGASPSEFLPRNRRNYFLANCKWRPHKRLKSIVKSFLMALDMGLDSDLVITGKADYKLKHPRIRYKGWVQKDKLARHLSKAIASIHLSWLDWFPNAMVEAVIADCPIIYTKSGGHEDVARNSGIGIKDTQWDFEICDLYDPPKISREEVAKSMIESKKGNNITGDRSDLHISLVASKYINYFESLLKGK